MARGKKAERIVIVEWEDASMERGTFAPPALEKLDPKLRVLTAGVVVKESRTHVSMAVDKFLDGSGQVRDVTHIPRGMIRKMRTVKA